MSGSNGGGGRGRDSDPAPCEWLKFEAQIASPQPTIVAALSVGEVLEIAIANLREQLVVQVQKNGVAVGGLIGPDATRLRACIESGHTYRATVRALNGGQVRVFVEHD